MPKRGPDEASVSARTAMLCRSSHCLFASTYGCHRVAGPLCSSEEVDVTIHLLLLPAFKWRELNLWEDQANATPVKKEPDEDYNVDVKHEVDIEKGKDLAKRVKRTRGEKPKPHRAEGGARLVKREEAPDDTGHASAEVEQASKSEGSLKIVSPVYAGYSRPTIEDCRALDLELAALHGTKAQPPASGMSVMDSLVATILSQNTTGSNSRKSFASLKERFPTWEQVRTARTSEIEDAIRSGGLAAIKAKRIQEICHTIHRERGKVCLEHLATASSAAIKEELGKFPGHQIWMSAWSRISALPSKEPYVNHK
jgi:hypothetical protein